MSELTCISPIDGSVLVRRDTEDAAALAPRLAAARAAQKDWAVRPLAERVAIVDRAIAALEAMNDEIVPELARMMGRPVRYGGEIGGVKERAFHMTALAKDALEPTVIEDSDAFRRFIAYEPLGLVLVVAPWNYPYLTAVNTIVPALAAGNAVVLKHSTQTILAGERFAAAFRAAGLPDGLFQAIHVTHETAAELLGARAFDFVNFTGSVGGGRAIERAAAGTFTGVGLELGGKDPGYVRADADLDAAVETLIDGAMFNSGQCCCGIERIYVADALFDAFVEKAVKIVEAYRLGDPLDPETTLGPMANIRFAREVRAQVKEAIDAGARALIDPALFPADTGDTAYLAPQILIDVDHSMRVMRDESFGPVVGIMRVSSDAEAISLMNDSPFGLTASLWTRDADAAERIGRQIETGTIYMNRCDYLDPALCWTGCKDTGRGAALSTLGYRSVTRPKSYHLKKA
ncbi:aldehyde dehydrogenase family protein [Aurantimonas sp. C2-6-R+9]|uniref:aldehyde dehydrogenase family protein n=1 Tax=unclassified Aurantimonas TaxID=2638230 RepID=UPI002E19472A|nr:MULTISPECIES: aldehyde dehydrogenase family protein [unclassified Aurantimonas]MEC5291520.1 aldehyde dehydrogenase family protein [Aurantimonas sp. C2-3-R2]MEC5381668.1 aldehyde dehydrogenase family protein [Aurantimonas sp. C2-6-R+9]MEC5412606.1 aldehyde dehydrogenase family protein [Aurantimonas sp. C2-4-R8]